MLPIYTLNYTVPFARKGQFFLKNFNIFFDWANSEVWTQVKQVTVEDMYYPDYQQLRWVEWNQKGED